jgi:hypothetical protein
MLCQRNASKCHVSLSGNLVTILSRDAVPIARELSPLRANPCFEPVELADVQLELVELEACDPERLHTRWRGWS